MKKDIEQDHSGFTVTELFIVVSIMGILAGLVFVQFNHLRGQNRDDKRVSDIRFIESKLSEYNAANGAYPAKLVDLKDLPKDVLVGPTNNETYVYNPTPVGCTSEAMDCTGYTISSDHMERQANPYMRTL